MRANQGFYKFKKDITRKAYDTQAVTGKVIDLRNNVDGYAVVGSTEGDMIKSIGKNVLDAKPFATSYNGTTYKKTVTVDNEGVVTVNIYDGYKTTNSGVSDPSYIKIFKPCVIRFYVHHISGNYWIYGDEKVPSDFGFQTIKYNSVGEVVWSNYSAVKGLKEEDSVNVNVIEITQDDIENDVQSFRILLWSNGTSSRGGSSFDDLKYTIMATIDYEDDEYEPYKEERKVCNQNDRCYINTFANGSVYSENNRTITVNFPKSMFASAYRSIANRVNSMDGDDYEEKTVNFFGDSITAGTNTTEAYHMWLSRYTGFHCKNWGVGGSGYIQELTGSFHTGDGVEGIAELKPQTGNNKILTIMQSVGELGNCMIFAGTNDWGAARDIDTFRTAVQNTLDYAWEHSDRLLVLTPIKRYRGEEKNSAGKRLHEFSGVVIEECIKRGIPYIDGYEMPFDSNNDISALKYYAKEGVDKVHINEAGHKLMAGYLLDRFKAVFK